ncbi:dihydrolipoyl dehydrogenase [Roseicella sp. DB1501]|uniref:dihydrolipoyl dehydrogenase n=1 Tax=Roseicella sp. DB1501 TaxID=2730925 RepID=UPI001490A06D|nr:dihydrolipoyl dehydrogenase [Roseicella sp. DB1501]NOG71425.1 dihydrolipoyl dehydrogenase [Roseicella sp. DB1501]
MGDLTAKLLVLGGGPGGYTAAVRAGQLGVDTILVEQGSLGGTCLNIGCIPSKALIHVAAEYAAAAEAAKASPFGLRLGAPSLDLDATMAWKDGIVGRLNAGVATLLKGAGVRSLQGRGRMLDGKTCRVETDTGPQTIRAEHVLLATGSEPVELPALPFGGRVLSSTGALSLAALPERLAVVGAGYIGLELGMAFARLGVQVTMVEAADRILPGWDAELTRPVLRAMDRLGMALLTGAAARGLTPDGTALRVATGDGGEQVVPTELVLVAVGRRPRTQGFGLEGLDLTMDGAFLRIDARCATSMRNVWAVGDITPGPMLAHRAMAQGHMVAEIVAGARRAFDAVAIPAICFTGPEVVSVGLAPAEARRAVPEVRIGQYPFSANGRALTEAEEEGFVRVVARADSHLVLGIQAVGAGVSELAAGFALALEMGARLEDIAATVHAHPTRGEALQEAALRALGQSAHGV